MRGVKCSIEDKVQREEPSRLKTKRVEVADKVLEDPQPFRCSSPSPVLARYRARTGLVKSSALRLPASLEAAGFVALRAGKRYTVGAEMFRTCRIYPQTFDIEAAMRPILRDLGQATGESGSFFRREGWRRVCVYR